MNRHILNSPTFRLMALPSWWEGVGSLVDLAGSYHRYNVSRTPEEADQKAFRSDWEAIALDLHSAVKAYSQECEAR